MYGDKRWSGTDHRKWKTEGKKAIRRRKERPTVVVKEIDVELFEDAVLVGGGIYLLLWSLVGLKLEPNVISGPKLVAGIACTSE